MLEDVHRLGGAAVHEVGGVQNAAVAEVVVDEKGELRQDVAVLPLRGIAGAGGVGIGSADAAQHADGSQLQGIVYGDVAAAGGRLHVDDVAAAADGRDFAFTDAVVYQGKLTGEHDALLPVCEAHLSEAVGIGDVATGRLIRRVVYLVDVGEGLIARAAVAVGIGQRGVGVAGGAVAVVADEEENQLPLANARLTLETTG